MMKARIVIVCSMMLLSTVSIMAEEGFTSIFNGKDFTGWVGNTNGYEIKDGVMSCLIGRGKGGNVFHEKEYSSFVLRFEFKLTAGANNGLALRAPLVGNPAKTSIECQVLDNTAAKYAKLQPGQYHGSLYKFAPAKRGFLKPVGEWNSQEVRVEGDIITVILNGETIIDHYDISSRKKPKKGHIGWLGHGTLVHFKNIRIKELDTVTDDA